MKVNFWTTLTATAFLLASCSHNAHHHEAEEAAHHHDDGVITLSTTQVNAAQIIAETIQPMDFEASIRVGGQVTTAQGDEFAIVAKSAGIVRFTHRHLSEGSQIKQGEQLASISAAGMQGGDEVARNQKNASTAKVAFERAQQLVRDTLISQKEYERIKAEYEQSLLVIGGSKSQTGSILISPIEGFLRSISVKEGQYVEAGQEIATVTKTCKLQLRAELPEKYYREINNIRSANFEMSYGGEIHQLDSLDGHLVSKGQAANESSAYLPITFEFTNDGCIVPGSFADIWLLTELHQEILSVPTEAISEEQGLYYIYIMLPQDSRDHREFEKREVKLGMSNGKRVEIIQGLKAGEAVVTQGMTQVRLSANSEAIPEAHSHNH